jgi:DNA-binding transcriptional LysR family regulator
VSLTLDALYVLDAIDRRGSFAAAAEELHRVPSAVSYTIQKLEQDLDALVFDRKGHRATLTPAGRALLEEGRHLLRAAEHLESHIKRVATGWESELRIAVEAIIPMQNVLPLLDDFYIENGGTRLRLQREVLGGTWDALSSDRVDLVLGASGEGSAGGGYATSYLGEVDMVFTVAPHHPLAELPEPLTSNQILQHRAVAIADTSRNLPPRSAGLLSGQDVLTVADMPDKVMAQCQGLGVGYLPINWIRRELAEGKLITKEVEGAVHKASLLNAWRSGHQGKALAWFKEKLKDPTILADILADVDHNQG